MHQTRAKLKIIFFLLNSPSLLTNVLDLSPVVVRTNYGQLEGFIDQIIDDGQLIDVFLGVPYAQPPVGELRFEKPLEPHKWEGVRAAKAHPPACVPHARPAVQDGQVFSEDCLFLNVFAPHNRGNSSRLLPILFIIHGGGFELGSAKRYDHRDLAAKFVSKGIVVVTVQYRLGVLGFASTGDKVLPGNLGLWDLAAALRWLKTEAKAWGGDPRRITAFGHSAGAAAVSGLAMSPYTRQLFQQAVQMSGSPLAQSKSGTFVPNDTLALAMALDCPTDDSVELKECLRQQPVDHLHAAVAKIGPTRSDLNFVKFSTRQDGHFFPRDLVELIHESPPKRSLMGHTRLESLTYTLIQLQNYTLTQFVVPLEQRNQFGQADFEQFVRQVVAKSEHFGSNAARVQREIIEFFTREHKVPAQKDSRFYLERLNTVLSDLQYVMPYVWESRLKADSGWPLFLYEFAWTESALFPPEVSVQEAFHGLDHDLLFDGGQTAPKSDQSKAMGRLLNEGIANFVLNGNPSTQEVLWMSANQAEPMRHLVIDGLRPRMKEQMELTRLKFWHQLTEVHREYNLISGTFGPKHGHEEL